MAGKYSAAQRAALAKKSPPEAMPDGSYPIVDAADMSNAITAYDLSSAPTAAQKAWIIKRASELGLQKMLPKDWDVS